jgi:hypothetical protein
VRACACACTEAANDWGRALSVVKAITKRPAYATDERRLRIVIDGANSLFHSESAAAPIGALTVELSACANILLICSGSSATAIIPKRQHPTQCLHAHALSAAADVRRCACGVLAVSHQRFTVKVMNAVAADEALVGWAQRKLNTPNGGSVDNATARALVGLFGGHFRDYVDFKNRLSSDPAPSTTALTTPHHTTPHHTTRLLTH